MVRIVGAFSDQLPQGLAEHATARIQGFSGRSGETLVLDEGAPVVYLGLGSARGWVPDDGYRALQTLASVHLDWRDADTRDLVAALATVADGDAAREIVETSIALHSATAVSPESHGAVVAGAMSQARTWTNASARTLNPGAFCEEAILVARDSELSCEVLRGDALLDAGFGAIHAMGSGSPYPPALIDMRYRPARPKASITLVGKGVTFDTGGLSLKSPGAMAGMRQDKCGAATVLAVMSALRALNVDVQVRALLPVIENMIGPSALRPGDTVTAWNGTQIRVMDTDFEGRVVLADALAYAAAGEPDLIIDIATLTYQVVVALGPDIGGLFTRDDATADRVLAASMKAGEALWRLPYATRYLDQVTTSAGVKNHPETDSGRALTAALFLGQFVPEGTAWAHLDISGPAWRGPASEDAATGFGVRTLLALLRSNADLAGAPRAG